MASLMFGIAVGICTPTQAQMGGLGGGMGGGMPAIPGTAFAGATDPSSLQAVEGLRLIPSVQISERYDSNVFFASKSQLQGLTPDDFVTTALPQVRGLYADSQKLVKVNAMAGAVGSYYVNHPDISYVGANAGVALDMSDLLNRWRPGATWTVTDTFFYSPQAPSFLPALGGQALGPAGHVNPLVVGFQAPRINTTYNSVNTALQFPVSQTVNLTGSYTKSFIHYGSSQVLRVPQAAALISQDIQAYTAGLLVRVTAHDNVMLNFTSNEFDLGAVGEFTARGSTLGWSHQFSTEFSVTTTGGVQVLSGELNGVPVSAPIAPFGSVGAFWNTPATRITLTYRSGIVPSFQFRGAAMLNHAVTFNMVQNTPIRDLAALLVANYSVANQYGSNSGTEVSWTTVEGTGGLLYRATQKTFVTLTYSYLNVENVFAGTAFPYDRHVVQLSLGQAFY